MSRTLTSREKQLLLLCFGVLVLMGGLIVVNTFLQKRSALAKRITTLQSDKKENEAWLADRAFWEKRKSWLAEHMPATDSLGKAQGVFLEELQNAALDRGIKVMQQTLPDMVTNADYREVSVNLRLYGDQSTILQWLATMQSPDKFQVVKALDFELDTRSKEKTPQAQCNLTVARWFKPEGGI
ncbi:MAG: hypothetical protein K1X78_22580 [Verrucomicrobiaceae bacterium]|nr:hypothetical protein [Verrucomicrobiaceae bacterium]